MFVPGNNLIWLIFTFDRSHNFESLENELVLRNCSRLVAKDVIKLCQVFMQVKIFDRASD